MKDIIATYNLPDDFLDYIWTFDATTMIAIDGFLWVIPGIEAELELPEARLQCNGNSNQAKETMAFLQGWYEEDSEEVEAGNRESEEQEGEEQARKANMTEGAESEKQDSRVI
ncbi:hypothetical protein NX059_011495 [Plenodomus lindquistii]|nr:hypothetical protein NX059_011495 [Plenodomus lindquistii]